jgi:hypothetical protein
MRYTLLAALLAACSPIHGTAYSMHYDVVPRKIVLTAVDVLREQHFDIVALESPDVYHNAFLAFADGSTKAHLRALLVQIDFNDGACRPEGCGTFDMSTQVAVTPLAFHNGHELPAAQVPPQLRAQAEQLMYTIYDRNRGNRHFHASL